MTLVSFLVFLAPTLAGILIVHLVWSERRPMAVLFKIFLGAGVGLGVNSLIYFLCLLNTVNQQSIFTIQILLLVLLMIITIANETRRSVSAFRVPIVSRLQVALLTASLAAVILSGFIFLNLSIARPQGTYDTWGIWNRAARFIYRDPENWKATASPELYWATHPDYPLLVPLNVAWGWARVGAENQRIPQMQSALFTFASIGLMFTSIGLVRTLGQASLASLILMATPILLDSGYSQISDIPLSFFILATCVLMYFYFKFQKPPLLILSGVAAGLAAWTKNEGAMFVVVSFIGLSLASRRNISRTLFPYLLGLLVPLLIVLYFKLVIAPGNDIFSLGDGNTAALITDLSRYWQILRALFKELANYAGWPVSIFILLAVYAALMRFDIAPDAHAGTRAVAGIVIFQLLGYCAIYVLTPHDLAWHLNFSFARLIFHFYPAGIFLYFCSVTAPEKVFSSEYSQGKALR
jgi:hypothetical protein